MDELRTSDSSDEGSYREAWEWFYSHRRRLLIRLLWVAVGLAILVPLQLATLGGEGTPLALRITIALSLGLLIMGFLPLWFHFVWQMATWPCPRCSKRFFFSVLGFDPFFTRRCRHCGLVRLKSAEVKNSDRSS